MPARKRERERRKNEKINVTPTVTLRLSFYWSNYSFYGQQHKNRLFMYRPFSLLPLQNVFLLKVLPQGKNRRGNVSVTQALSRDKMDLLER